MTTPKKDLQTLTLRSLPPRTKHASPSRLLLSHLKIRVNPETLRDKLYPSYLPGTVNHQWLHFLIDPSFCLPWCHVAFLPVTPTVSFPLMLSLSYFCCPIFLTAIQSNSDANSSSFPEHPRWCLIGPKQTRLVKACFKRAKNFSNSRISHWHYEDFANFMTVDR